MKDIKQILKRLMTHEALFGYAIATIFWLLVIVIYHLWNYYEKES